VSLGGKVIASPIFVPVFFSGDDATMVAKIEDFDAKVGASSYWKTVTDEYGVGAASATAPVMLTETAPLTIDDTAIQTWLAAKINSANPAFPAPTAKTIYVLHYPAATTVTIGASRGCQDFGSYHSETMATSTKLAYAVVPRCADYNGFSGVDAATALESQALVDAATDPHPLTDLAYASLDDAHLYWTVLGSEAAGLCANMPGTIATTTGLPYAVQRSWSNAAAAASHDPCVPQNAGQVYFNAVPVLSDDIPYPGSTTVKMKGVKIPPNGTKTINVQLFSDAATTGAWTVAAYDGSTLSGGPARLTLALDRATGVNGDQLQLTITVTSAASNNIETFFLTSTLGSEQHLWVGLVGN
jgi:hypothetical protein